MLLNNEWVKNEVMEEIKTYLENTWTYNSPKPTGHSKGSPEIQVHSKTGLPREDRKISNKQPNPTPKRTRRTTINKAHSKHKE